MDARADEAAPQPRPLEATSAAPRVLFFAPHTIVASARAGINRVVLQFAKVLVAHAKVEFVKWDPVDGQLRYCNRADHEALFRTRSHVPGVEINRFAERRRYRFEDTLPPGDRSHIWLLCPEMSYQSPCTTDIFAALLTQARDYRIRTAAIFYDLIPVTNPLYDQGPEALHARYVHALLAADLILPISVYAADDLARYYRDQLKIPDALRRQAQHAIVPLPLATINVGQAPPDPSADDGRRRDVILLLGTVEPRKQQIRVLQAIKSRRIAERHDLKVVVIGSLHHAVVDDLHRLAKDDPRIEYRGYASDAEIDAMFARSRFSVFASNDEGFGLPICESLVRGVPCLTANFGAMQEVGDGGGCVLVDVNDDEALAAGLERLAQDDALCTTLRSEIGHRAFRTWDDYAKDALRFMSAYPEAAVDALFGRDEQRSRQERIASRETMLQSFYPPIAGGAILSIVIPTCNHGPVVEENVRWILSHIERFDGRIHLTVVDDASTDDTSTRLERFKHNAAFEYLVNAVNVGRLGNLQVCAALMRARHVWVIGDHDVITPDTFERVVDALRARPSLPFVFLNSGTYDRLALGPADSAEALIRDPRVASDPLPTGLYPVREIGALHDELFAAVHSIIFRVDTLAACFNAVFAGLPSDAPVESIPTAGIVLENYASTQALWLADIGIVGPAKSPREAADVVR